MLLKHLIHIGIEESLESIDQFYVKIFCQDGNGLQLETIASLCFRKEQKTSHALFLIEFQVFYTR